MSARRLNAAVVQAGSALFDHEKTMTKAADFASDAARLGAEVVVFPEAFLGGYPKGFDFGARVGFRSAEGREEFRLYFEQSISVPGPACDALGEVARLNKVYLIIGVIEREHGTLYCTVLFFAPDGTLAGKHRKLMPTASERLIWGQGDGSTLTVLDTDVGRLGAVICWENYMPLLRMAMYRKGIQLYCAPTVDDRDTWLPTMRHIAAEGRCFVLSACQYLTTAEIPETYRGKVSQLGEVAIRGGSCIVGPLGEVLAGPDFSGECILTAELDLSDLPRAKFDLDVTGHYARPDVFRLIIDERPQKDRTIS